MEITEIHKELDIILNIIAQMKENSFKVKSWMISIFGALLAFSSSSFFSAEKTTNTFPEWTIPVLLMIVVLVFWFLDTFFLKTEKLYREVYNWNVKYRKETDKYLYNVNTFKRTINDRTINLEDKVPLFIRVMFSKTLIPFYLLPFIFSVAILCFVY